MADKVKEMEMQRVARLLGKHRASLRKPNTTDEWRRFKKTTSTHTL